MHPLALAEELGQFSTATLFEAVGKTGDLGPTIRPMIPGQRMAGIAKTLRVWPGDTLGVIRLIDAAPPGAVLVIDAGSSGKAAVWGGLSSLACVGRGVRGCVTNGCVRDMDEIAGLGFPIFAAGVSPRGTLKTHPGWPGISVCIGDAVVSDGDIVVGDANGVLVIAAAVALALVPLARSQAANEAAREARLRAGESLSSLMNLLA